MVTANLLVVREHARRAPIKVRTRYQADHAHERTGGEHDVRGVGRRRWGVGGGPFRLCGRRLGLGLVRFSSQPIDPPLQLDLLNLRQVSIGQLGLGIEHRSSSRLCLCPGIGPLTWHRCWLRRRRRRLARTHLLLNLLHHLHLLEALGLSLEPEAASLRVRVARCGNPGLETFVAAAGQERLVADLHFSSSEIEPFGSSPFSF